MMSSFTTFLLTLRYVVLNSFHAVHANMYELHFHSGKENVELSRIEIVTGTSFRSGASSIWWGLCVLGYGFCQWLWVVSQCVMGWFSCALPCSLFLLNAWYPSASVQCSLALLSLTPKDAPVGVSSKESLTNESKVSSVHPMRTELGKFSS